VAAGRVIDGDSSLALAVHTRLPPTSGPTGRPDRSTGCVGVYHTRDVAYHTGRGLVGVDTGIPRTCGFSLVASGGVDASASGLGGGAVY
jgi:hypothetical protein